jgi:hypothetical protein
VLHLEPGATEQREVRVADAVLAVDGFERLGRRGGLGDRGGRGGRRRARVVPLVVVRACGDEGEGDEADQGS